MNDKLTTALLGNREAATLLEPHADALASLVQDASEWSEDQELVTNLSEAYGHMEDALRSLRRARLAMRKARVEDAAGNPVG